MLELFRRPPGGEKPSRDTSVMFLLFAQWFTDSFLRTASGDRRLNTSNHEIDLCQIYGLDAPTARELEVLAGVARGLTNAEIGRQLFIGEATVKTHLMRVFAKLGVDDRTRAVMVAVERGLLASPGR